MVSTELNGLNLEELRRLLGEVEASREAVRELSRWRARVRWVTAFKSTAYLRNHTVRCDEAASLHHADTAPNSVELVLAALGSCLTVGFIYHATRRGVRVHNLEVALEGQIDNILRFLGLSGEGHPGYREVRVKLYVRADADRETLEALLRETLETSPVGQTLLRGAALTPELAVVE